MKLIVGLGNPGKEYEKSRHNVGFIILDSYFNGEKWHTKDNYEFLEKNINNEKVIFIKPLTFMNLSGLAVQKVANFYKIPTEDILIIHDDLDLPEKTIRFKFNSSAGGHNGIKSIIDGIGTKEFVRLKIGISNNKLINTKDYVLGKFNKEEIEKIDDIYLKLEDIINDFVLLDVDKLKQKYNNINNS